MRWLLMIGWLLISANVMAEKDSAAIDDVYKLSPAIYDVKGMGEWKVGSRFGQIRLVLTRSVKQDEAFLQWVQWNDKGPEKVRSTVVLKEIQQEGRFKVTFIRRESYDSKQHIILGLENLHDKSTSRAIINIENIGLYSLKFE